MRRSIALSAALIALLAVAGCRPAEPTPQGQLLGVPTPEHARVEVGDQGIGVDGSDAFVTFVSVLPPADARAAYASQLQAHGFAVDAPRNGWDGFTAGDRTLWVSTAQSGPPTLIVVRVELHATVSAAPAPPSTTRPDGSTGSASPRPGATPTAPPSPASSAATAPTLSGPPVPEPPVRPGGNKHWTPPGQGGTPPGQGGTPPGQGNGHSQGEP